MLHFYVFTIFHRSKENKLFATICWPVDISTLDGKHHKNSSAITIDNIENHLP